MSFVPFSENSVPRALETHFEQVRDRIASLANREAASGTASELSSRFVTEAHVRPLELLTESWNIAEERNIQIAHPDQMESRRGAHIPGTQLTITVPFEGQEFLWKLRPTKPIKECPRIEPENGKISLLLPFPDDSATPDIIDAEVHRNLHLLTAAIATQREDVDDYNSSVLNRITELVAAKRQRAEQAVAAIDEVQNRRLSSVDSAAAPKSQAMTAEPGSIGLSISGAPATPPKLRANTTAAVDGESALISPSEDDTATHDAPSSSRIGTQFNPRREATEAESCLQLPQYAAVLARLFQSAAKNERFCFGLFGHWGRGKTHLMARVRELLEHRNYVVVAFSAWKYRTTPELWAHLYEAIYVRAAESHPLFPLRMNLDRYGLWPAITSFCALNIAVVPAIQKLHFLSQLVTVLGWAAVLYLAVVYLRTRPIIADVTAKYFSASRHFDKLGLQFAIGEDLKAVLTSWITGSSQVSSIASVERASTTPVDGRRRNVNWSRVGAYVTYGMLLVIFGGQLWLNGETFDSNGDWGRGVVCAFAIVLPVVLFALPVAASLRRRGDAHKALLIVDDLDRCAPEQILEIIECLQLFLDDDTIASRLQICMLVEEDVLSAALLKKYGQHFGLSVTEGDVRTARLRRRIVVENLEKLFLVHLRLGELSTQELQTIMDTYCQTRLRETAESSRQREFDNQVMGGIAVPPESAVLPAGDDVLPIGISRPVVDAPVNKPKDTEVDPDAGYTDSVRAELTEYEIDKLISAVPRLETSDYAGRWGPRSVRKFVLRYQLARMLLVEMDQPVNPDHVIAELLRPPTEEPQPARDSEHLVRLVVSQVS